MKVLWIVSLYVLASIFLIENVVSKSVEGSGLNHEETEIEFWKSNERQIKNTNSENDKGLRGSELRDSLDKEERKRRKKQLKLEKKQSLAGKKDSPLGEKKKRENKERVAIRKWAESLTEKDFDVEHWKEIFHSRSASDFFNGYGKKISIMWKEIGAKVNFALVGACDGLGDNTIKHLYLPNDHWRGVFVEPVSINVKDLIIFMAKKNAAHRSLIIRAAATERCKNDTIKMERPLYEEKNKTIPHWLRRQIGSILPQHRDHARKEWIIEEVRCITGREVLEDWAVSSTSGARSPNSIASKKKIRRPHILKIDVEGHDYEVLMGFLRPDTPPNELPLIIEFEAKSIGKKYPAAKERMEELGYVVTPFGQDGFAILKKQVILDSLSDSYIPMEEEPDV